MDACLLDKWTQQNNFFVKEWKLSDRRIGGNQQQGTKEKCHMGTVKLLQMIQGVPADIELIQLELTVAYNTLVFSFNLSTLSDVQDNLTNTLLRAHEAVGCQTFTRDPVMLWHATLKSFSDTAHLSCLHNLLCVQWALLLASCQMKSIHQMLRDVTQEEVTVPSQDLRAVIQKLRLSDKENSNILVAITAREFKDLLQICTVLVEGLESLKQENYSAALVAFLEAMSLPAPRALLAQVHTLTGFAFAKLNQPQSALQSYRKALEVDFGCHSALYQSALVYRQLKNTQAEIEALRLLHLALVQHAEEPMDNNEVMVISPDVLLSSTCMDSVLAVPATQLILHCLAYTCVLHDRISEAVELYLDLMSSLQSDITQPARHNVLTEGDVSFLRVAVVYLEAAFTLLRAKRMWDAITVCEDVITKTMNLIPEKLLFDLSEEHLLFSMEGRSKSVKHERLENVLWAAAAHYLQGLAYCKMKDTKESVSSFTRSLNWLAKVSLKSTVVGNHGDWEVKMKTLQRLRGLALAGRGVSFMERGQLKEALRDLKLSLQSITDLQMIKFGLVEVYRRLGRQEEAIACWREPHISAEAFSSGNLPLYLQTFPDISLCFDISDLNKMMEDAFHRRGV
ncbi:Fanconi anemia group G protein isoform X1 [Alosa sapidissima]|uniref:Fanconi anemia group G protein isoform X1 n=1 Tax=Alosa sapidissima TaxID=34773 RepID=UPI001C0954E7|nr:Fanconi anemia group G protein isoform X1 [Alosa sapidissima]